jgi:hypothetical protein
MACPININTTSTNTPVINWVATANQIAMPIIFSDYHFKPGKLWDEVAAPKKKKKIKRKDLQMKLAFPEPNSSLGEHLLNHLYEWDMIKHIKSHDYSCDKCNFHTLSLYDLEKHKQVDHAKDKAYTCMKCHCFSTDSFGDLVLHDQYSHAPMTPSKHAELVAQHNAKHTAEKQKMFAKLYGGKL